MSAPATATRWRLAEVGAMDRATFVAAFEALFEHAPWVAEAAWEARPFATVGALHGAMMAVVRGAPPERVLAFLNGHPELAGREAAAGTMTAHSTHEQQGGGLTAMHADALAELRRLNAGYRARHGFPFIIAVLDHDGAAIVERLRERLPRETPVEREEALAQIARITRRRLDGRLAEGG